MWFNVFYIITYSTDLQWLFNGIQVEQSSMYTITMATVENAGLYLCQASNIRGSATSTHNLSVIRKYFQLAIILYSGIYSAYI